MKLLIVFAQRKESYEGEYAPEVIAGATEFENDENPDFIQDELKSAQNDDDYISAKIIEIEVSAEEIYDILCPNAAPIIPTNVKEMEKA